MAQFVFNCLDFAMATELVSFLGKQQIDATQEGDVVEVYGDILQIPSLVMVFCATY